MRDTPDVEQRKAFEAAVRFDRNANSASELSLGPAMICLI